jgi:uncharacterized protein (DUF2384 family)
LTPVSDDDFKRMYEEADLVENLQKALAFYMGEGNQQHTIEMEYQKLRNIPIKDRTPEEIDRLVKLARILSKAVDAHNDAFTRILDDYEKGQA